MTIEKDSPEWEGLCKKCGKCCHKKYNLVVFALADPEYVCRHLNDDNSCEIYQKRLKLQNCHHISEAIKMTRLAPPDCGYIHMNPNHQPLIFPESIEEFWKLARLAESLTSLKIIDFITSSRNTSKRDFKIKNSG